MKAIHPIKAAVTLAVLLMLFHACWAATVAIGWAQPLINFILRLHFIQPFYVILPFDFVTAFMACDDWRRRIHRGACFRNFVESTSRQLMQ